MLFRAMQYAGTFGHRVWLRPQDPHLARGGVAHDGEVATRLGLPAIPVVRGNDRARHDLRARPRDRRRRAPVPAVVRRAAWRWCAPPRREGLPVTCDVAVHHLHLCDVDIGWFDPQANLMPPLRGTRDRAALRAGVADGTIDAICSDHAPVDDDGKQVPFARSGARRDRPRTAAAVDAQMGSRGAIAADRARSRASRRRRRRSSAFAAPALRRGSPADLCVFDPSEAWTVRRESLRSQGKNTPFLGIEVLGRVRYTLLAGQVVHTASNPS